MFGNSSFDDIEIVKLSDSNSDKIINNNDIAFSKKAQHQCDADENLFLRFLELDPPSSDASYSSKGRTPFTLSKKLVKSSESSFGFSIVWTHPPRIEKIEPNSSAEKVGMLPGDYVIFIDKYNVVTMPELDILNLIRMQGNSLNLEIFRRTARQGSVKTKPFSPRFISARISNQETSTDEENSVKPSPTIKASPVAVKSSSPNISLENTKRRLRLPQVASSSKELPAQAQQHPETSRKRYLIQLINREQHFVSAITFGLERFVHPLRDRKDIISLSDHKTLFQNIDEIVQISEDILEQILQNDHDPQIHFASRVYLSKSMALCAAYKKYCNGLKRADCVLVNKSRTSNSEFSTFLSEPPIPKKRPDITTFIHRPLNHFRDILKLIQLIATSSTPESDEYKNFTNVISELQAAYREITVGAGLMEPLGEGRPLLSLQDLESRLVFTKCKPFTLSVPGRQWIFGGDLSRIDGRSIKQFWTLLFSDIILFAKVSRDRVLFITDEPLPLSNIVDCVFNVKKKNTEFRLIIDPSGQPAKSPNVNCTPDLSRTPLKSVKKRTIMLRAPSVELKAVWQNLLTRQIFIVNSTLGSLLSSPLESPDVMVSHLNLNDVNLGAQSMASSKMCSIESFNIQRNVQQSREENNSNNSRLEQQKQNQIGEGASNRSPKMAKHFEDIIDEKCNLLSSKSGISKEGSAHLAQWMKCQFNKTTLSEFDEDEENQKGAQDWSAEQVVKRSKELQLMHETKKVEEELTEDEQQSTSKSTTSDSQITVRSSPINNNNNSRSDSLSICRQCHKFCKKKNKTPTSNDSNNNQVNQTGYNSQDTSCGSNSTIKEDSAENTYTDDMQELKASQTMVTFQATPIVNEICLKTSVSSPSALQTSPSAKASHQKKGAKFHGSKKTVNGICNCECKPKDFEKTTISPDEVKHEIVKILSDIDQITNKVCITDSSSRSSDSPYMSYSSIRTRTLQSKYSFLYNNNHMAAAAKNQPLNIIKETMIGAQDSAQKETAIVVKVDDEETKEVESNEGTNEGDNDENLALMLIDIAQTTPITSSVPAISILPPTPDLKKQHSFNPTKDLEITKVNSISIKTESSFDSVDDEDEEPPYVKLKTSLRRFGTMSSLERLQSEDTDEKTLNSSEEDSDEEINKTTTKDLNEASTQSFRTWTSRAGSFLEESKAFIDKYLGRTDDTSDYMFLKTNSKDGSNDFDEYETIEGETSGATSGEEVWGTPTSGGENDELHMFNNGNCNQTSPKSSSGDEDTEIMMDELLMAPMMTTSNIRGLLPRRRLEPLFEEEDTDSCDSNENSLLNNKEGEGTEKNIVKYPSSHTSNDSDQATPSIDEEMINADLIMSPTTRLAQQDMMSPLEDLDLDEMDVGMMSEEETLKTTTPVEAFGSVADKSGASALFSLIERNDSQSRIEVVERTLIDQTAVDPVSRTQTIRTSRSLEMRLAMSNDVMGDEDLMGYVAGPKVTSQTILLGRDLSSYHRLSGRDIIMNRIVERRDVVQPCSQNGTKPSDQLSSYSQQNNSKMDTPILNRKLKQRTWSSSGFAQKEEKTVLSDLEKLARREKIYCMTQQHNSDSNSSTPKATPNKSNKLLRLLRRNSESIFGRKTSLKDHGTSSGDDTCSVQTTLSNKENVNDSDSFTLDRRFLKQLTKRRRSHSLSDFSSN